MNQGYEKFFKEAKQARKQELPRKKTTQAKKPSNDPFSQIDEHFESRPSGHHLTPEQKLKIKFIERKRQLKKQASRVKPPYFAILCFIAIVVSIVVGYLNYQKVTFILKRIDIEMNGAQAANNAAPAKDAVKSAKEVPAAANPADPVGAKEEKKSQTEAEKAKSDAPDLRNMTKEELSYFSHLVDRKKELDQREAELNKLDEELQKQRVELDQKIQKLEKMRTEISGVLKDRVQVDQEKVEKLVQFYSTMKAQQAARVLENLNEDLAVEVLDKMKKKSAAEIMNSLDPKKAKKLSELLAGYRKPASDEESKR